MRHLILNLARLILPLAALGSAVFPARADVLISFNVNASSSITLSYSGGSGMAGYISGTSVDLADPNIAPLLGAGPCVDCAFRFQSGPLASYTNSLGIQEWDFGALNSSFMLTDAALNVLLQGQLQPLAGTTALSVVSSPGSWLLLAGLSGGATGGGPNIQPAFGPGFSVTGSAFSGFADNGPPATPPVLAPSPGTNTLFLVGSAPLVVTTPEPGALAYLGVSGLVGLALSRLRRERR